MPSTPQTQSFNRKSITLFTKCDELAKIDGTEVFLLIRRRSKISIYQTDGFWLSQDDIVGFSPPFETSTNVIESCLSTASADTATISSRENWEEEAAQRQHAQTGL